MKSDELLLRSAVASIDSFNDVVAVDTAKDVTIEMYINFLRYKRSKRELVLKTGGNSFGMSLILERDNTLVLRQCNSYNVGSKF
jgi:hypothetical protein